MKSIKTDNIDDKIKNNNYEKSKNYYKNQKIDYNEKQKSNYYYKNQKIDYNKKFIDYDKKNLKFCYYHVNNLCYLPNIQNENYVGCISGCHKTQYSKEERKQTLHFFEYKEEYSFNLLMLNLKKLNKKIEI